MRWFMALFVLLFIPFHSVCVYPSKHWCISWPPDNAIHPSLHPSLSHAGHHCTHEWYCRGLTGIWEEKGVSVWSGKRSRPQFIGLYFEHTSSVQLTRLYACISLHHFFFVSSTIVQSIIIILYYYSIWIQNYTLIIHYYELVYRRLR